MDFYYGIKVRWASKDGQDRKVVLKWYIKRLNQIKLI